MWTLMQWTALKLSLTTVLLLEKQLWVINVAIERTFALKSIAPGGVVGNQK